jgi:cytochrome c-type biogenesis protein CcmH
MKAWFFALWLTLLPLSSFAAIEITSFDTPEQEALYKELLEELRCLVCQNQNLADSNAGLALDLRRKAYEMVAAGENKRVIVDYMVDRYGDFVLYRPPFNLSTLFLWLGPLLLLLLAIYIIIRIVQRQQQPLPATAIDTAALQQAESLLANRNQERS